VEQVEAYSEYDEQHLSSLAKHLALPPNDCNMDICAILVIQIHYHAQEEGAGSKGQGRGAAKSESVKGSEEEAMRSKQMIAAIILAARYS
jgi:hypothetical protein